jgi:putative ATP-dependent endonuclease of OLD family
MDPRQPKEDGTEREPLGPNRVVNQMLTHLVDRATWEAQDFDSLLALAPQYGVFTNEHTFEVDLFNSGLQDAFAEAMDGLSRNARAKERMKGWAMAPDTLEVETFLKDIVESDLTQCPQYISDSVIYVSSKCKYT